MTQPTILVTGGAGFIGFNFVNHLLSAGKGQVVNLDKLTHAVSYRNVESLRGNANHIFVRGDIADQPLVSSLLRQYNPEAIVNFAAESHVDRSIADPTDFIQTNVVGTFNLLEASLRYWKRLPDVDRSAFRFLHVSTDEVYGSLEPGDPAFTETTAFAPNSPYSASKAASNHLVRAYHHTYGLPALTTNCSNTYGPYQFPEKLIPLVILNALKQMSIPVYGDGQNIRDWLYVTDHCDAIREVLASGRPGEVYNIGGNSEKTNLEVVHTICDNLDEMLPRSGGQSYDALIAFVTDRPGHDRRYAIDATKIRREIGWVPKENFETGIRKTVKWYIDHAAWRG